MTDGSKTCCATPGKCWIANALGVLLVRIVMGIIFIYYGGQHCFGLFGGRGIEAFSELGALKHLPILPPMAWAWISGGVEFFGGILLIIGLVSRIVSILLIVDMIVAMWFYHAGGFGTIDFNLALVAMAGLIVISGPGMISVDTMICPWCKTAAGGSTPT